MLLDWGLGLDRDTSFSPAASRRQRLKLTTEEAQPDGTTFRSVPEAENGLREIGPRTEMGLLGPCSCYGMNHGVIWRGHR